MSDTKRAKEIQKEIQAAKEKGASAKEINKLKEKYMKSITYNKKNKR